MLCCVGCALLTAALTEAAKWKAREDKAREKAMKKKEEADAAGTRSKVNLEVDLCWTK